MCTRRCYAVAAKLWKIDVTSNPEHDLRLKHSPNKNEVYVPIVLALKICFA